MLAIIFENRRQQSSSVSVCLQTFHIEFVQCTVIPLSPGCYTSSRTQAQQFYFASHVQESILIGEACSHAVITYCYKKVGKFRQRLLICCERQIVLDLSISILISFHCFQLCVSGLEFEPPRLFLWAMMMRYPTANGVAVGRRVISKLPK